MTFQQAFQAVGQAEDRIFRGSGGNLLSQEPTAAACSAYISPIKHYQFIQKNGLQKAIDSLQQEKRVS